MDKYSYFHGNDNVITVLDNIEEYCRERTEEEQSMRPFLSFPIIKDCNFSCVYCGRDGETTASTLRRVDIAHLKKLVEIATDLGIKKFRVTGGEPFMHKDIEEILSYFDSLDVYTLVNTNGSFLTRHKEHIRKLNPDKIKFAISLDTLDRQKFVELACPCSDEFTLDTVIDGARLLAARNLLLRINMVTGKHNIEEVTSMIKFCQEIGCNLKLLDVVSVPVPNGDRGDYYIDLTELEAVLDKQCKEIQSHSYTKSFGVPVFKRKFDNIWVTVKNGSKGTHYDKDGACKDCAFFPCHEGLYDIFALPDGRICSCRWTEKQEFTDSRSQLEYMIESFRRANYFNGVNRIHQNMAVRSDL